MTKMSLPASITRLRPEENNDFSQQSFSRVNEIDLLRFCAAMLVLIFHYCFRGYAADGMTSMPYPLLAPIAQYTHLGVNLFFLVSGFVIMMTASSGDLKKFVVSRIVRLYPAFWFSCSLTFVVTLLIGGGIYAISFGQYVMNMTMLSGFWDVPPADGVYWSLLVEMRFYAFVAMVLLLRKIHRMQELCIAWLVVTIALDFFPSWKLQTVLITAYAPEFIAGITMFSVWKKGVTAARIAIILLAWLVAVQHALGQMSTFEHHYHVQLHREIVVGIITFYFGLMFLIAMRRTGRLANRQWMTLGAMTYPLYLIHQNVGYMIFNVMYPAINPHILLWGTVLMMLALAYWVHVYIEKKIAGVLQKCLEGIVLYWNKRALWRKSS